ncbi:hypothetical protein BJY04DRAFT_184049 [Aspergillus karnatakaensis]|uniref:uncharacterized protein n=1 Tax=Aspergillus karnatakaensis TaxID=1810916 RepID=UPI003CCD1865
MMALPWAPDSFWFSCMANPTECLTMVLLSTALSELRVHWAHLRPIYARFVVNGQEEQLVTAHTSLAFTDSTDQPLVRCLRNTSASWIFFSFSQDIPSAPRTPSH